MKIISFMAEAGGTGKSTLCFNTARLLSADSRVLVMDLDGQQGNITFFAGISKPDELLTMRSVLMNGAVVKRAIVPVKPGFDIVPADATVSSITAQKGLLEAMIQAVEAIEGDYDYLLIDLSPAPNVTHLLAAGFSDFIVIPILADAKSVESLRGTLETLKDSEAGKGIVFNKYSRGLNLSKAAVSLAEGIAEGAGAVVFDAKIRSGVSAAESIAVHLSVPEYARRASVAEDIRAFVNELKGRVE